MGSTEGGSNVDVERSAAPIAYKIPDKRNQHPLHKPAPSIFPRPNPQFRKEMFGILAERVNIRLTYVYNILILHKFCYFSTGKGGHLWGEGPAPLKP